MIAVCGGATADSPTAALAEAVGAALAQAGAVVVCGGLGGVMEAACRGAKRVGGTTVGIVPGTDAHTANAYVDIPIASGMAQGRNAIIVHTADGVIALPGSYGTLSEVALALNMGKPVVALGGSRPDDAVQVADDPQTAVQMILALLPGSGRRMG
ncbi:MAG: TIGR00725 family protein [Candidatus Zixiibacteriota bacterium]